MLHVQEMYHSQINKHPLPLDPPHISPVHSDASVHTPEVVEERVGEPARIVTHTSKEASSVCEPCEEEDEEEEDDEEEEVPEADILVAKTCFENQVRAAEDGLRWVG
jgi:hypothetical protein